MTNTQKQFAQSLSSWIEAIKNSGTTFHHDCSGRDQDTLDLFLDAICESVALNAPDHHDGARYSRSQLFRAMPIETTMLTAVALPGGAADRLIRVLAPSGMHGMPDGDLARRYMWIAIAAEMAISVESMRREAHEFERA